MWKIGGKELTSRLFIGSALYPSLEIMKQAVIASQAEVITVSLRRQTSEYGNGDAFWTHIKSLNINLLPNTAGCFTAKEAITTAQMAREVFDTRWIKLEVIGDEYTLQPDPFQ
ncbi:MAG: thiazole synthase, partial [Cocleimonas sp.]|nr:thiazole synthase [Cocleimonas sp.]